MADEPLTPETPDDPAADMSIAEFEAEYSGGAPVEQDPEPEPEPEPRSPARERDDQGKFVKPAKPEKHRAAKQEATPKDVPRIAELTRRLREAEAERDRLKAAPPPAAPVAATPAPTAPAPAPAAPKAAEKPKIENFQEYSDYVEALADWKIAEARRQDNETRAKEADELRQHTQWVDRVTEARKRYADFDAVALLAPTRIPQGSLVDAWIREHRSGTDVLYTLQSKPEELDRILALPLFDQVEALTLLGQRTGQPTRELAVKTGAAAAPDVKVAPRPPTPVRNAGPAASDEPPDPEKTSLAEFERYYHLDRRR